MLFARCPTFLAAAWLMLAMVAGARGGAELPVLLHSRIWRTDAGLPHNSVNHVIQDHAGFLWIGGLGGLARFDGREFKEVKIPAEYRGRGYNIRGLAEEAPGTLLVLSTSGMLLRVRDGEVSPHPIMEKLSDPADRPGDFFVEPGGVVWTSTQDEIVRWRPDGEVAFFAGPEPGTPRSRRFTFAIDQAGETWVGAEGFLAVYREGILQRHAEAVAGPLLLEQGRDGRIWVCTPDSLMRLERGRLRLITKDVPWSDNFGSFREVIEGADGALLIALSRQGLVRFADGRMIPVPTPFTSISCLFFDREGLLWAGTNGEGLCRLTEKSHRLIDASAGLQANLVSSVAADAQGRMWLANRLGGVVGINTDGSWVRDGVEQRRQIFANVAVVDREGRIWSGGGNDGLFFTGADLRAPLTKAALPLKNLHLLHCARNGDVWFVAADSSMTPEGEALGFFRAGVPRVITKEDGFSAQRIRAVAEDADGHLWFGGHNGDLMRWDGTRIEPVAFGETITGPPIHDMIADGAGELWIATAEGLVRRQGGRFYTFTRAQGLPDELLMQIAEDDAGRLWIVGRGGLFYVAKEGLREVIAGRASRAACRVYGRNQGLPSLTGLTDYHPKTAKGADGRLWFSTAQGAVVVDPSAVTSTPPPPPMLIDDVRLNGEKLAGERPLRVPPGRHSLEFLLATPSFHSPEDVQVSYRLRDVDTQWIEAGGDRVASYRGLPPGNYQLRAKARLQTGAWSEEATLAFAIMPAWWETMWFRAGVLVVLAVLSTWLIRVVSQRALKMRLKRLEQEHALEKERARIARDLHDDLGSGLTALGMLAERIGDSASQEVREMLNGFSWRTRTLAAELSSIVWTMESGNGRLDRFCGFVRQYAQRLFRHTEIVCAVHGVERIPPIPLAPESQHQLLSVVKEALNNIVKHAQATEAELAMSFEAGVFVLSIRDNGAGFDVTAATVNADGNGLRNMRNRAVEIGGELTLESAIGRGSELRVTFPCTSAATESASKFTPASGRAAETIL